MVKLSPIGKIAKSSLVRIGMSFMSIVSAVSPAM
jgi:hypothetical protein